MKKLIANLRGFAKGFAIGIDWYYYEAFNKKLPKWLCWVIGFILMPLNWVIILIACLFGKKQEMLDATRTGMIDVAVARQKEKQ